MRFARLSKVVLFSIAIPSARGDGGARDNPSIDAFKTQLTENRARCGFMFHNGTVEYAVTDKDVSSGLIRPTNAPKPIVVGPNSPAVRNVNVAVNITKPLVVSTSPQDGNKVEMFQVRRESPANLGPTADQVSRSIGGVSLQTSSVVPITIHSSISLKDVRIVREMTASDRWNGSVLKPRGSQ